jgi:hypothetical protein
LFFDAPDSGPLTLRAVFTPSENTAATPIAGMLANLADDSTLTFGSDAFQTSYQGG